LDDRAKIEADEAFMRRCFDLAVESCRKGGYPFASVVVRKGRIVAEATNRITQDRDVTRHAEVVALAEAQRALHSASLDDCSLYTNVEPCALCAYAIREARVARVAFGLSSPVMGGFSRWPILDDERLSAAMPEVFAPPPEIVPNLLAEEADAALRRASPLFWRFARSRRVFACSPIGDPIEGPGRPPKRIRRAVRDGAMRFLRRRVFDRFGRRGDP
jgi:tRNA(adenine34) deaminase